MYLHIINHMLRRIAQNILHGYIFIKIICAQTANSRNILILFRIKNTDYIRIRTIKSNVLLFVVVNKKGHYY